MLNLDDATLDRLVFVWTCSRSDRHSYRDPVTGRWYVFGESGCVYAGDEAGADEALGPE